MKKLNVIQIGVGHDHAHDAVKFLKTANRINFLGYVKFDSEEENFKIHENDYKECNSLKYEDVLKIENLDCVIKLEKPKFIPYRNQVINSIAKILDIKSEQVFVKAKTGEKIPPVGTSEAIEAYCVCLLSK